MTQSAHFHEPSLPTDTGSGSDGGSRGRIHLRLARSVLGFRNSGVIRNNNFAGREPAERGETKWYES
jgi:hypothetical protein